jgi:hypothetical protein
VPELLVGRLAALAALVGWLRWLAGCAGWLYGGGAELAGVRTQWGTFMPMEREAGCGDVGRSESEMGLMMD